MCSQLHGDEIRALRELRRQFPDSAFVFATSGRPFMPDAINRHVKRLGERAGFAFQCCGMAVDTPNAVHDTTAIQDWLGYRSIQHTVRYTELGPTRFRNFWR